MTRQEIDALSEEERKKYYFEHIGLQPLVAGSERAKEVSRKGVLARCEKSRERKAMKATLNKLLTISLDKGEILEAEDIQNLGQSEGANIDLQTAMLLSMIKQAMTGDVKAAQFVRDTIGERPKDEIDVSASVSAANKLSDITSQLMQGGEELEEIDDEEDESKEEE